MFLFALVEDFVALGFYFDAHWILKGVPKSIIFKENQKNRRKKRVQIYILIHILFIYIYVFYICLVYIYIYILIYWLIDWLIDVHCEMRGLEKAITEFFSRGCCDVYGFGVSRILMRNGRTNCIVDCRALPPHDWQTGESSSAKSISKQINISTYI